MNQRRHFVGVGGVGMSAIAQTLLEMGWQVSGSDIARNSRIKRIEDLGGTIHIGHHARNIDGADAVIVSSAISVHNPEVKAAIRRGVPILHRSEMLARLMEEKKGVCVAGTHGKTTTTAMTSLILERAGLDPTALIGGDVEHYQGNSKLGKGDHLVAEADESDGSLVRLHPFIGVITNIEADHMDYYSSLEAIQQVFGKFLDKIPNDGGAVLCFDDPQVRRLAMDYEGRTIGYGLSRDARLRAAEVKYTRMGVEFSALLDELELGRFSLQVPGLHNVSNALAAIGVGLSLGVDVPVMAGALSEFRGARRRFQVLSNANNMTVVDDYAHHPTEIMATLSAARKAAPQGRVISVFQPHRYTRTQYFQELYGQSFFNSDQVIVTEIYPAGEKPIPEVDGKSVTNALKKYGHKDVTYIPNLSDVPAHIMGHSQKDDLVITLGAGDVWKVAQSLSLQLIPA